MRCEFDDAAVREDDVPLRQFILPILRAFDVHVDFQTIEQYFGRSLRKSDDCIHAPQAQQHGLALRKRHDRTAFAFDAADRFVRIQTDDQRITLRARPFQICDVARMEHVKDAVGKDHALALRAQRFPPCDGFSRVHVPRAPESRPPKRWRFQVFPLRRRLQSLRAAWQVRSARRPRARARVPPRRCRRRR